MGTFKIRSKKGNVDLVVVTVPPNRLEIEQMELFHQEAQFSGNEKKGFSVFLNSGARVDLPEERLSKAPFWIHVLNGKIHHGRDHVASYSDMGAKPIGVPGSIEVGENTHLQFLEPTLDLDDQPFERKAYKVTASAPGGGIAMNMNLEGEPRRSDRKVGRNEPCPCGSGKKYKFCHGKPSR